MIGYSIAPNIEVFPVLRYRLSFAHQIARYILVAPALTVVAVELPHFLDRHEWLSVVLDNLPKTSNILVEQPNGILACPAVPNDAVWLALWAARKMGFTFHCVDDCIPARLPDIPIRLRDDTRPDKIASLQNLVEMPSVPIVREASARAARVFARLKKLGEGGPVIFVCDWRLAAALIQSDSHSLETLAEPHVTTNAAIVPEDPLLLWQRGDLDDIPAVTASAFELLGNKTLSKLDRLRSYVRKVSRRLSASIETTLCPASNLLDPSIGTNPPPATTKLAKALLSYPEWKCEDLANGSIPRFAGLQGGRLVGQYEPFFLPDVLETTPMYPRSDSELALFTPREELSVRRYWGPDPEPPITRSESLVHPTEDERWTVPASFFAMGEGARYMREAARLLAPEVECDLFTPVCWWFRGDCDGDFRSVADATNPAYRIDQISEFPQVSATIKDDGAPPDAFHTVAATRALHARLTLGIFQDIACSISTIYTGPEKIGTERYKAVAQKCQPRTDPSTDPNLAGFNLDERPLAYAIVNAPSGVVLLAHSGEYAPSDQIQNLALQKAVRIVRMPLSVIPPAVGQSVQRRIFISKNMRWSRYGERIGDRAVNWRVSPVALPSTTRRLSALLES
jgi:hypothetical protein